MNEEELFESLASELKSISMDESNKIVNIDSYVSENGNISIQADDDFFNESFYTENIYDGQEYSRFIKSIVSMVRTSSNYSRYVGTYMKDELGLDYCSVLGHINDEEDADIEMHHYPFTLYDICDIVTIDKIVKKKKFTSFSIADEVMKLHYENLIGLVPLSETVHQLVHSGELFINLNQVFGDVQGFIDIYSDSLTDDHKDNINKLIELSKENLKIDSGNILKVSKTNWNKTNVPTPDINTLNNL